MRSAVIVSTARTPIGRAYRGAFNDTPPGTLAAHALTALERAGLDPAEVEDCLLRCSLPQGVQHTVGRMSALRGGFPVSVAGMTMDRQCSSRLVTIATAAKQIIVDHMQIAVAGGVESISMVQTDQLRAEPDPGVLYHHPDAYMSMLDTAETVARAKASHARPATPTACNRGNARPPLRPLAGSTPRSCPWPRA